MDIVDPRQTYRYDPTLATKWQLLAKGIYFTSCLTQCTFISPTVLLTAGTDGHAVLWPLSASEPNQALKWQHPARIHQNASKSMATHVDNNSTTLIISGGDDGALAFLLAHPTTPDPSAAHESYASPPVLVSRAHGSAVTACAVASIGPHIYVLTSGNDEWVRLWEVAIDDNAANDATRRTSDMLTIKRLSKAKTSVADVSSMAVLSATSHTARVLLCGVGMEVIRVELSQGGEQDSGAGQDVIP